MIDRFQRIAQKDELDHEWGKEDEGNQDLEVDVQLELVSSSNEISDHKDTQAEEEDLQEPWVVGQSR